jgi:dipeptidase D
MSSDIRDLEPRAVWGFFHELTRIPRPSRHEEAIQEFMVSFGERLGLETVKDAAGNVIIRKPATQGMEDRKGIVLQAHLDMVPQANRGKEHDFTKDPITPVIDGDWVRADGTTLGSDNGIGVAAAMAVLASTDVPHGMVEGLFTATEETGMDGAEGLEPGILQGDVMLNLDSEDEGEVYVGCAGGLDGNFSFPLETESTPAGHTGFTLSVTGLTGGHSGVEIHLERGNANRVLFRFLARQGAELGVRLASVDAGGLRNAIPREAFATITLPAERADQLAAAVATFEEAVKAELHSVDPGLRIQVESCDSPATVMSEDLQGRLVRAVNGCPNGIIRWSTEVSNLVETSTNLASVKSDDHRIAIQCLLRSSVDSAKDALALALGSVFELAGAEVEFAGAYPGWKPNMDSEILKVMQSTYEAIHGRVPETMAIHAGLECGLIGAIYPNLDMASFGPTIRGPHSPDERVEIQTVGLFYGWLLEVLRNTPRK